MPAGGACGGVRRLAASRSAHLLEAPSHGPTMRIRITDMATAIRATDMAIRPTATVIRPTVTAMDQAVPAMAMGQAPPVILKPWHNALLEISELLRSPRRWSAACLGKTYPWPAGSGGVA